MGNALFLKQGYTIVWTGWDPDAPKTGNGMTDKVPVATDSGKPIVRTIREELVSGTRGPVLREFTLLYDAASTDQSQAKLTDRRREGDPKVDVPKAKATLDEMGWSGWLVVERSRDAKKSRDVKYNFSANAKYLKSVFQAS